MDDRFARWERGLLRAGGLVLLAIAIAKIVAAELGLRLPVH